MLLRLVIEMKNKQVISLVVLLLAVVVVGTQVFYSSSPSTEPKTSAPEVTQPPPQSAYPEFKTATLYDKIPTRKSPFLSGQDQAAEFVYQSTSDKKRNNNQKEADSTANQTTSREPKVKELQLDLEVTGLIKNQDKQLVIIKDQSQSYILQVGERIKGYRLVEMKPEKMKLKKEEQLYKFTFQVADY